MGIQQLRIFMYHNIGTPPLGASLPKLYVETEQFDRQCRLLSRLGIRGVSMGEGLQALRAGQSNKLVVLSFDDGYTDNLTNAAPILQRYGFHATCYVVSGAIGGHNAWDAQILGVEKPVMDQVAIGQWLEAGHEIGSHTVTHPRLAQLDRTRAAYEISESRRQLEEVTGSPVEHFCYPFGDYDDQSVELVREAGYVSAVTVRRGPALQADDPLRLPRISVNGGRGMFKFGLHAATPYSWLRRQ
jgi:peptidoglycan/xylan/chitin deacetylase (PgdA/CDA1 family)